MEKITKEFYSGESATSFASKVNGRVIARTISGTKKKFIVTYVKRPKNEFMETDKVITPKEKVFTRNKLKIALEISTEFGSVPKELELLNVKKHMEAYCNKTYKSQDLYNVLREYEDKEYLQILEIIAETYISNN